MKSIIATGFFLLLLTTGCFNETRTYSLAIRNRWDRPVSICLAKTHGPDEPMWITPEEMIEPPHPATDQRPPGAVIQPGKSATMDQVTGRFDPARGRAFLRIYAGTPDLSEMNAISAGSPNRRDVPLDLGMNRIEIKQGNDGYMTAVRVLGDWPATQPSQH